MHTGVVFAAPPDRCPVFLQAALTNVMIPTVIVVRLIILRKVPSLMKGLCAIGVVVGLFSTSIPTIFDLSPSGSQVSRADGVWKVLWPIIFMLSFIPAAIYSVLSEKYLQRDESGNRKSTLFSNNAGSVTFRGSVDFTGAKDTPSTRNTVGMRGRPNRIPLSVYLIITNSFQILTFIGCFWYDLLPTIGFADNFDELLSNFKQGLRYSFALDGADIYCCVGMYVSISFYCSLALLFSFNICLCFKFGGGIL